jgi:hypothetical protein
MPAEHYRPEIGDKKAGYYQGYYCGRCGAPGLSMMGRCTGYNTNYEKSGVCISNPLMVAKLSEANTVEAETKRKFVRSLHKGKGDHSSPRRYK